MDGLKEDLSYLDSEGRAYVRSELRLAKLEAVETLTAYSSDLLSLFILTLVGLSSYLISMLALGVYFAQLLESLWQGIAISAGISVLVLIAAILLQKHVLHIPIQNRLIRILSKHISI